MQAQGELERLRELFLEAPESRATGIFAIVMSTVLLLAVLYQVRHRKLREEYTPIWVVLALSVTVISLRLDLLRVVTRAIGAWTPSSTLFFLGELFLLWICLNYAVRLSRHTTQLKNLAQETAILRARVEELARPVTAGASDGPRSSGPRA
jgi:hypothetical protein